MYRGDKPGACLVITIFEAVEKDRNLIPCAHVAAAPLCASLTVPLF